MTHRYRPVNRECVDDLLHACWDIMAGRPGMGIWAACQEVVTMPARRFYVEPGTALLEVRRLMEKGCCRSTMPTRQAMYGDLLARVMARQARGHEPLEDSVTAVVLGTAPRYYMTPGTAYAKVTDYLRRRKNDKPNNQLKHQGNEDRETKREGHHARHEGP